MIRSLLRSPKAESSRRCDLPRRSDTRRFRSRRLRRRVLARYHDGALDAILQDLAKALKRVRSRTGAVAATDQLAILQQHAGEDLLEQASRWFQQGEDYRSVLTKDG